jgi:hypothetical protein
MKHKLPPKTGRRASIRRGTGGRAMEIGANLGQCLRPTEIVYDGDAS